MKKKVVVGMSGGVDSSVAAALLLEEGFEVIGITMKTYDFEDVGGGPVNQTSCCGLGAMNDARAVAVTLGIPHYVVDFRDSFEQKVISNFVSEYLDGRTPNPCVVCNREIKWGELLKKANALGADYIATGHYARSEFDPDRQRHTILKGRYKLKDQSYALWGLSQGALAKTKFPLGDLEKPEVRALAKSLGLRTAQKDESFEICFIADNNYERFLKYQDPALESAVDGGNIIWNGAVVGTHRGFPFYTIGQRRGIGAFGRKMYVTGIGKERNEVYVGGASDLERSELTASQLNWVSIDPALAPMDVTAKIRYNDVATSARIYPEEGDIVRVVFEQPKRAITAGQSVVFYANDLLLGGGIIDSSK